MPSGIERVTPIHSVHRINNIIMNSNNDDNNSKSNKNTNRERREIKMNNNMK